MFSLGVIGALMPYLLVLGTIITVTISSKTENMFIPGNIDTKLVQINPVFQSDYDESCYHYISYSEKQAARSYKPYIEELPLVETCIQVEVYVEHYKSTAYSYHFSGLSPPLKVA